jgi:type IV pilus assembly protein PilB
MSAADDRLSTLGGSGHLPVADLRGGVDEDAARAIPLRVLRRAVAVPYRLEGDRLKVAIADPSNVQAIDELQLATSFRVDAQRASRSDIEHVLQLLERGSGEAEGMPAGPVPADAESESGSPAVRLLNEIVLEAAQARASDIHFLPQADALLVRARIDGVIRELRRIPNDEAAGVIARAKVVAKLDVAEHRKPQDGRFSVTAGTRALDVRVATLPSIEGEGAIMRLLDKSRSAPTLTEIGLSFEMQMALEEIIHRPTGALLVTGPTGSGKSTTLYAALADIARPEINVITVEDPVEYRLPGIYQLQMNTRAGVTFASALRSILRSDPDVVMVGEIRDAETARISVEAALAGHFVLSTLHTNDAPSAITRLTEMGVEPYLTASAVTAVLAQRLVRKLCSDCREQYVATPEDLRELRFSAEQVTAAPEGLTLYRPRGCEACNRGYRGRIGVYQLMAMNESLARLAVDRAGREELEGAALGAGMKTLWDDGIEKVVQGHTSIEELRRVLT